MLKRKSRLNNQLKREYTLKMKDLKTDDKINQITDITRLLRQLFQKGLKYQGFSEKEIDLIWKRSRFK
jgi:hypothetical protein